MEGALEGRAEGVVVIVTMMEVVAVIVVGMSMRGFIEQSIPIRVTIRVIVVQPVVYVRVAPVLLGLDQRDGADEDGIVGEGTRASGRVVLIVVVLVIM